MPAVTFPTEFSIVEVERPGKQYGEPVPPALRDAIAATLKSGKAIKVDGTAWAQNVRNAIYRRVLALNKDEHQPLTIHGRRDDGLLYFWATSRRAARRRKKASRA